MKRLLPAVLLAPLLVLAAESEVALVVRDHIFQPTELHVPAGRKVLLTVENRDGTAEEFESYELNREKVVPADAKTGIYVGPLAPGRYPFFGDFHQDTARGVLIAE